MVSAPLALVALAAVGAACCTPAFVAQRPHAAPDPQVLMGELKQRQQVVRGVDLETRAESWLGGQRTKATVLMLVERGGRLRFEAEVALQGAVATLVTDAGNFAFLDLQERVYKARCAGWRAASPAAFGITPWRAADGTFTGTTIWATSSSASSSTPNC
jgi:hypothetical protein